MPTDPAIPRALELLRKHEGFRANAYPDPATGGEPWTIGYGATGPSIAKGVVWTRAQAEEDLARRLEAMLAIIRGYLPRELPADALAALLSLAYNIGCPPGKCRRPPAGSTSRDCCCCRLETSSVLARIKAGDLRGAALAFSKWTTAAGSVNPVLMRRRLAERSVFALACGVVGLPTT